LAGWARSERGDRLLGRRAPQVVDHDIHVSARGAERLGDLVGLAFQRDGLIGAEALERGKPLGVAPGCHDMAGS
jgi:hypothetical protein